MNYVYKMYFKGALAVIHLNTFEYIWIHLNTFEYIWGFLQWSSIFKGFVTLCKKHLLSSLFFKGIELIRNSSCSHSFDEWLFFYYKRTIAATHSFKFTVFLQNRNCSKEISYSLIMLTPWFRACILKEVCYLTASIVAIHFFCSSVIISREHLKRSICQENRVLQHLLQSFSITSGLWLIRENWKGCLFEKNHCNSALIKVSIYSTVIQSRFKSRLFGLYIFFAFFRK